MIIQDGNKVRITSGKKILRKLGKGIWLMLFDEQKNEYYLEKQPNLSLPSKIYGNSDELVDLYLKAYNSQEGNLGIWFCGKKGCGKTLLSTMLIQKSELPTIVIKQPFTGDLFHQALTSLNQQAIVWIDEFEKVYKGEVQEEFLTVLDGGFDSNKIFIFATNEFEINNFLRNRPGRIKYLRKFNGLSDKEIEEIIDDRLLNQENRDDLRNITYLLSNVSPDVLITIIDEMNLLDKKASEIINSLNIQVEHDYFEVLAFIKGRRIVSKVNYNPILANNISLDYKYLDDKDRQKWGWYSEPKDNMTITSNGGEFIFKDTNDNTFYFKAAKAFEFDITQ